MASHLGILAVLQALRERLPLRMAARAERSPPVEIIGSQSLTAASQPNTVALGLYLHRIAVDPFSRHRHLPPTEGRHAPLRPHLRARARLTSGNPRGAMPSKCAGLTRTARGAGGVAIGELVSSVETIEQE